MDYLVINLCENRIVCICSNKEDAYRISQAMDLDNGRLMIVKSSDSCPDIKQLNWGCI